VANAPRPPNGPPVIVAHPTSSLQAGIAVAHDAIGSLGAQPVLLLIVVVNLAFIGAAAYFLATLEASRVSLMISTLDIVKACVVEKP